MIAMDDRIASRQLTFDGKVAKGYQVGLRMADGNVVTRDFFHYDRAAVILPILDDGSIVMIRNYRFAVDEQLLELPAGMLDDGEDPVAAAGRELAEETGYTPGRIESLGYFYTSPGTSDAQIEAFLATELTPGRQDLEPYEEIAIEVMSEQQVRRAIIDGTIHDAKTVSAMALYWLRHKKV